MSDIMTGYIDWFCSRCNKRNDGHIVECAYCGEGRYQD